MATDKLVDFDHVTDYISREAAIEAHCMNCQYINQEDDKSVCWCMEKDRLNQVPAADVVEVVRCKNCKWWAKSTNSAQGQCIISNMLPTGEYYCGSGRKREKPDDNSEQW